MIYGSSPYLQRKFEGALGATGSTGSTGPSGRIGPTGARGNTGNTGGSITGMTLSGDLFVTTFSDGKSITKDKILGSDGNYYIFADGSNVSSGGATLFSGLTYLTIEGTDNQTYTVSQINFRGITTSSRNGNLNLITIESDTDSKNLQIRYNLSGLPYLGICAGSEGQLIVHKSGATFNGLTGTNYDAGTATVNFQTTNYGERVEYVTPIRVNLNSSNIYFYWQIDWEKANTFVLNSYKNDQPVGTTTIAQVILLKNPPNANYAKSLSIVVPSGITSGVLTKYAVADDITTFNLSNGDYSVSWPLTFPPCLTSNTDIINMVYIDGVWYANYGIYNSGTEEISWNSSYNNCSGSGSNGGDNPPPPPPPVDPQGLCCVSCDTGTSFVTLKSGCQSLVNSGHAQFFEGKGIGYEGCTSDNAPVGICCYVNSSNNVIKHNQLIRQCDCSRIAVSASTTPRFRWQIKNSCFKNLDSVSCPNFDLVSSAPIVKGACCTPNFGCMDNLSKQSCDSYNGYWQGEGTVCTYPDGTSTFNRCSNGTGGCCSSGTCTDVDGSSNCSGSFYGCGHTCGDFAQCTANTTLSCTSCFDVNGVFNLKAYIKPSSSTDAIESGSYIPLRIGDSFAGGIVAGVFNPNGSRCLGPKAQMGGSTNTGLLYNDTNFPDLINNPTAFSQITRGQQIDSSDIDGSEYNSIYDPMGYGFTLPDNWNLIENGKRTECDSWLLIVAPFPARITEKFYKSVTGIPRYFDAFPATDNIILSDTSEDPFSSLTFATDPVNTNLLSASRNVNLFSWSHGGTSHCLTLDDNLDGVFSTTSTETCNLPGTNIFHDGSYGTLPIFKNGIKGSTFWGNTTTFDTCGDVASTCTDCESSPFQRTRLGQSFNFTRNTGFWSRNWGIYNTCRLISSDVAQYYLKAGNGYGGSVFSGLKNKYGATGGFTASFFHNGTNTSNIKTTIGEAVSAYNNEITGYFSLYDLYYYGSQILGDAANTVAFPQISRWYVPSIDELSFIAKQCSDPTVDLQNKIISNNGIKIGAFLDGANGAISNGYVWTSTGAFDEGITAQYVQATGGAPWTNSGLEGEIISESDPRYSQISCRQFTKAWALNFSNLQDSTQIDPSGNVTARKLHDYDDKAELRLVRMIRCDQRYYSNPDTEDLRNRVWMVPKLTSNAIVNGTNRATTGAPAAGGGIINEYNSGNNTLDGSITTIFTNSWQTR